MKKMGRPKGDNNKEYSYTIRMDESTFKQLESYCERMGVMKSQAIRTAIENLDCEDALICNKEQNENKEEV